MGEGEKESEQERFTEEHIGNRRRQKWLKQVFEVSRDKWELSFSLPFWMHDTTDLCSSNTDL